MSDNSFIMQKEMRNNIYKKIENSFIIKHQQKLKCTISGNVFIASTATMVP